MSFGFTDITNSAYSPKVANVITNDLCISCGVFIPVCPKNNIIPDYSSRLGSHQVKIVDTNNCTDCSDKPCDIVCPSVSVDYIDLLKEHTYDDTRIGPVKSIQLGISRRFADNPFSSSGGIIRDLITYFISKDIPVICLCNDDTLGFSLKTIQSRKQIFNLPGSIYHSVDLTNAVELIEQLDQKPVIVAIPCLIEGIQKYFDYKGSHIDNEILFSIGIICGWSFSDHALRGYTRLRKINGVDFSKTTYRGQNNKKGYLRLFSRSGKLLHSLKRWKFTNLKDFFYYTCFFTRANNRLRCRLCTNHLNVTSDISLGDAWIDGEDRKLSIILIRTQHAQDIINYLHQLGAISLQAADLSTVIGTQGNDLVNGITAARLTKFLSYIPFFASIKPPKFIHSISFNKSLSISSTFVFVWQMLMRKLSRSNYHLFFIMQILSKFRQLPSQIYSIRRKK